MIQDVRFLLQRLHRLKKGDFERETGNARLSKRNDNNAIETRQEVVRIYLLRVCVAPSTEYCNIYNNDEMMKNKGFS